MIEYRVVYRWEKDGPQSDWRVSQMRQADEEGLAVAQSAVTLLLTPPTKVTEARIEQRQITDWSPVA